MSVSSKRISVSRIITAAPDEIFTVLSDASLHTVIDGSGSVRGVHTSGERLALGSRFGMRMRVGVPYVIQNRVVEFDVDRLIAWEHFGKHRWRYELEPVDSGTRVTETFDWSTSRSPKFIELMRYPTRHVANMERTLERLAAFLTNRSSAG